MTPEQRRQAIRSGAPYDRVPCVPFLSGVKNALASVDYDAVFHDEDAIVRAELASYERFGCDRIIIGPNTTGIAEALGLEYRYLPGRPPEPGDSVVTDYAGLGRLRPLDERTCPGIRVFARAAARIREATCDQVLVEMSIGGPFTIAAQLRGVEQLLRDCRKNPDGASALLELVVESQESCIRLAASCGCGVAMADPVAGPQLLGPGLYERFVFPATLRLCEYAQRTTGFKVSLHMCGKTQPIWPFIRQYPLNEISLDNLVPLDEAVRELGPYVPVAGNVDPVGVMLQGDEADVRAAVDACISAGLRAERGFTLTTGCDIPDGTDPSQVDAFMQAAGSYFERHPQR